jgi:hypothetical protein
VAGRGNGQERGRHPRQLGTALALCRNTRDTGGVERAMFGALGMDPRELLSRMLSRLHQPVGYRPTRTV